MLDIRKIPNSIKETGWSAAMFFWTLSVIQSEVMKYFPTSTINPQPSPCLAGRLWNSSLILKIYWYWVSGEEYLIMTPSPSLPSYLGFYEGAVIIVDWGRWFDWSIWHGLWLIYKSELIVLRCLEPRPGHIWFSRPYRADKHWDGGLVQVPGYQWWYPDIKTWRVGLLDVHCTYLP